MGDFTFTFYYVYDVCVSHLVGLFSTLWTVAHQAPLFMGSPGKDPGVGCHFLLQGSSQPGDRNPVSYVSCIGRQILYNVRYREVYARSREICSFK